MNYTLLCLGIASLIAGAIVMAALSIGKDFE